MAVENPTGKLVGAFRVGPLVARGAMASVYLAEGSGGQRIALKILSPELAGDARFRQRFLRESQLAATLDHPHVVRTIAAGEDGGVLYLAMEHVDGADLRQLLRDEGRLEPDRALRLVRQAAEALDAAHDGGLVHRDVKPGNILVTGSGEAEHAYVCDFGLARHVSSVGSLTGDRGFVGTVDYVAPEQIMGDPVDGRADVYALGCVLYECLAGLRPFERDTELAVVFAHLNEAPPRLSDIRPELPSAFDELFRTALAKSPDDRYPGCGPLVDAAGEALRGTLRARGRPRRRRRAAPLVTGLVLGAIVLAAATVLATRLSGGDAAPARAAITQTSVAGVPLGRRQGFYKQRFGPWRAQELTEPPFPSLAFQQRQVAVYFPARKQPAHIVTTWSRDARTDRGIGPCSTIQELKRAYGDEAEPTWAGHNKSGQYSYAVGDNLLFVTQDLKTIAAVVLYRGNPRRTRAWSPRSFANDVGALETACT
jgi:tRNA A-37 threonylcarbamoyl transferase component Bud32